MKLESRVRTPDAKTFVIAYLLLLTAFFVTSCQKRQVATSNRVSNSPTASPSSSPTPSPADVRLYHGTGVVTKIVRENAYDKSIASVELNHGEIVGLMPAMIMEFNVKNVSVLDGLKVGDLVDFTIEEKGSTEIISEIKKK